MKIEITCPEKWRNAWKKSNEAMRDGVIDESQSLQAVLSRVMNYLMWDNVEEVRISSDFDKDCFLFGIYREDGSLSMNGGIIFHGFPNGGYVENGSVQLSPNYGWHIHT